MLQACLDKQICKESSSAGVELTCRDLLKLSIPFGWTIAACCLYAYYTIEPVAKGTFPKTIPMYWSLISAFPAFMTALNLFIFHRDHVVRTGLSRASLSELTQVVRLISVVGVFTFTTLAVASALQLARCRLCDNESYKENVIWCGVSLGWMIVMACTSPTARHFSKLIFRYETFQQQADSLTPTLCCVGSAHPGGDGTGNGPAPPPSLRPVSWGGIGGGDTSGTGGTGSSHGGGYYGGNTSTMIAAGYPASGGYNTGVGGGARTLSYMSGGGGGEAEADYLRAATGAAPGQVVTGKVSSKVVDSSGSENHDGSSGGGK
ncbi:transmembrane protein [Cystoisospora suis]|uniref:Transmembrane protein n=1 Tax=Cystoisospora suis TaxID=483139 RepID=A0A2C6L475_9APIC|nr:transmembrane protein [Cystoisospora suis]